MWAEILSGPLTLALSSELNNFVHITQKVNRALIGVHRELVKVQLA